MAEDFTIIQQESEQSVRLEFDGEFEGRPVSWNAQIQTLSHCYRQQLHQTSDQQQNICKWRQFIEIEVQGDKHYVSIGLNLKRIDKSALKMAIIMMRKYKRLHRGRHEYGEVIHFKTDPG